MEDIQGAISGWYFHRGAPIWAPALDSESFHHWLLLDLKRISDFSVWYFLCNAPMIRGADLGGSITRGPPVIIIDPKRVALTVVAEVAGYRTPLMPKIESILTINLRSLTFSTTEYSLLSWFFNNLNFEYYSAVTWVHADSKFGWLPSAAKLHNYVFWIAWHWLYTVPCFTWSFIDMQPNLEWSLLSVGEPSQHARAGKTNIPGTDNIFMMRFPLAGPISVSNPHICGHLMAPLYMGS